MTDYGRQISECHRHLIRTGLSARFTDLIRVVAMATGTDGIGVETVVRGRGNQHSVAVNVDIAPGRPAP